MVFAYTRARGMPSASATGWIICVKPPLTRKMAAPRARSAAKSAATPGVSRKACAALKRASSDAEGAMSASREESASRKGTLPPIAARVNAATAAPAPAASARASIASQSITVLSTSKQTAPPRAVARRAARAAEPLALDADAPEGEAEELMLRRKGTAPRRARRRSIGGGRWRRAGELRAGDA